jgi:hypothetical protein
MGEQIEISAVHVRRFPDGNFVFSAYSASDEPPNDREATRAPTGGWLFSPQLSDLTESDWRQIRQLVESTLGKTPSAITMHPWERSWSLWKRANGSWIVSPF